MLLGREPALWIGAFRAILYAGVLFGLDLSDVQTTGLVIAVEAILALLTRSEVTPNIDVVERRNKNGDVVAGHTNDKVRPGVLIRVPGDDELPPDGDIDAL